MEHHTLGCVIFDLDGTLLDSMNVWSQIDRNLLNHYGKTAPDDLTEHWYNPWQRMLTGTRCH